MALASLYSRESIITEGLTQAERTGVEGWGQTGGEQGIGPDVFNAAGLCYVE